MFGLSFPEVLIIAVVALVVFGPEKLPEIARQLGALSAKARRTSDQLRREFYNELYPPLHEQQMKLGEPFRELRSIATEISSEVKSVARKPFNPLTDISVPPVEPNEAKIQSKDPKSVKEGKE